MLRASFAGLVLALSASTAFADPIVSGGAYSFVTSSSAPQARGTTTPPPGGGLGTVGGLCVQATAGCPAVDTGTTYALGDLVHPTPLSTEWDIPIDVPATVPGSNFLLSLSVVDDTFANFLSGSPAPSPGDIFEVTLNGRSLGTTGVVGLGGPPSSGNFNVVVRGGSTFLLGITDLLQPYADGLTDTLPSTLCGPSCAGLDGGIVQSSAFDANILDLFPTITPAPEPASLGLVAGGIAVLGLVRRRRRAG